MQTAMFSARTGSRTRRLKHASKSSCKRQTGLPRHFQLRQERVMKKNQKSKNGKHDHTMGNGKQPKQKRSPLHSTRIDLNEKVRGHLCEILNQTLADSL